MTYKMRAQAGIGLLSFLSFLVLIIFVVTVALKLGPSYMKFLTVRSAMNDLREDPTLTGRAQVLKSIDNRLYINSVEGVGRKDFKYKKVKNGYSLSVDYQDQAHLFGNLDALMTFSHQIDVTTQ